jgi:hypothetical protein
MPLHCIAAIRCIYVEVKGAEAIYYGQCVELTTKAGPQLNRLTYHGLILQHNA